MVHDMGVGAALLCSLLLMSAGAPKGGWLSLLGLLCAIWSPISRQKSRDFSRFWALLRDRCAFYVCTPCSFVGRFGVPDTLPFRHFVTFPKFSSFGCLCATLKRN